MKTNLLESYKNRLSISEQVYKKAHNGEAMDSRKKLAVAQILKNTNAFLNEAFDATSATQRADMGGFKKFCLNLTTVALPNLIAHDLVITFPMTSINGYFSYIRYAAGKTKGQTTAGDLINNPFKLGDVDTDYTNEKVVETVTSTSAAYELAWAPAVKKAFEVVTIDGQQVETKMLGFRSLTATEEASRTAYDVKVIAANGAVTYANLDSSGKVPTSALSANCRVAYIYK